MEDKIKKIVRESISSIKRDEKKDIFDYSSVLKNAWSDIIYEAQKFQKIHFDLENDDSTKEKRTFFIKKNLRKDQPVKYEINAELCEAGGDWEYPVMYFKIELTHNYSLTNNEYSKEKKYIWDIDRKNIQLFRNYVMIPPVEAGNKLKKTDDGWRAYNNNGDDKIDDKEATITDKDKKAAWTWLGELLETAVDKRHKMLDESKENEIRKIIREQMKVLTESPNFQNLYHTKKIFKEGLMKFENWIYIEGEKFQLVDELKNLSSILNEKSGTAIKYMSDGEKEVFFTFRVHKNSLIPNDVTTNEYIDDGH